MSTNTLDMLAQLAAESMPVHRTNTSNKRGPTRTATEAPLLLRKTMRGDDDQDAYASSIVLDTSLLDTNAQSYENAIAQLIAAESVEQVQFEDHDNHHDHDTYNGEHCNDGSPYGPHDPNSPHSDSNSDSDPVNDDLNAAYSAAYTEALARSAESRARTKLWIQCKRYSVE